MIEILTTGAPNSIQDLGRFGYLDIGVSHSGAMDRQALLMGNALLGNAENDAGMEIVLFPLRLRFHTRCRFALTGADCDARLDNNSLPPNWVCAAEPGQTLVLSTPVKGARAYISFAGGIDVPLLMGSRATDLKSSFGGLEGRGLLRGDRLKLGHGSHPPSPAGFGHAIDFRQIDQGYVALRVLPAAEHDAFTVAARKAFYSAEWTLTAEANRMGFRLSGSALALQRPVELLSHGIVPGTVQVPPSGQPIIQMAEANTCGGYPKIANVIEADLWRLAQTPCGTKLRFVQTDHSQAVDAMHELEVNLIAVRSAVLQQTITG